MSNQPAKSEGTESAGLECICPSPRLDPEDGSEWEISPSCPYHAAAAERSFDHSIPWNCPTYWDGCNCKATLAELRRVRLSASELERLRDLRDHLRKRGERSDADTAAVIAAGDARALTRAITALERLERAS